MKLHPGLKVRFFRLNPEKILPDFVVNLRLFWQHIVVSIETGFRRCAGIEFSRSPVWTLNEPPDFVLSHCCDEISSHAKGLSCPESSHLNILR
jgi:hypothetical protein